MTEADRPVPFLDTLRDLVRWLRASSAPGIVIGGVAASFLGRPRATRDVDAVVLVQDKDRKTFLETGARFGFASRVADALEFAARTRVLLVRHEPSGIDADIVFAGLAFEEEAIRRVREVDVAGVPVPLPTSEDLIVMKAVAGRARDIADIEAVLDANPDVDLDRIRGWLREFSAALDASDLLEEFERIIARRR